MKIKEDPIFQEFIQDRALQPATTTLYEYVLTQFCNVTNHTPTELIEEAEDEEDENIRLRRRKITHYFQQFNNYLEERDRSYDSKDKQIGVIRTFYLHYDIILPKRVRIRKDETPPLKIPTVSEIKLALKHSNPCFEAIIILMCSSGMGRAEILSLQIRDLVAAVSRYTEINLETLQHVGQTRQKILDQIEGPLSWKVRRIKTSFDYTTFSTKESLEYILLYLESKKPVRSVDDQLFLNKQGNPLSKATFSQYFRDLNNRCGFGTQGRSIYFRSHNLRKWFAQQLENTGMGYMNTRKLMGHVVYDQTSRRYFKTDEEHLYRLYFENMSHVSVYSNVEVFNYTDEEVRELKEDNLWMKEQLNILLAHKRDEERLRG